MKYDKMFEYTQINKMALRNRFVMSPMSTCTSTNFSVDDTLIDYYEERAKGGVGLIILEAQPISNQFEPTFAGAVSAGTALQLRDWIKFTTRLKGYGAKLCCQLTCGSGRNAGVPGSVSASEVPIFGSSDMMTRALTTDELHAMVKAFGNSAAMAKEAGFDCIEIHAHTGYLMDQFMSEQWNHRTDEYGGSFENRMRLPMEVLASARAAVGDDYPILFRFSMNHQIPGGRTADEGLEIVKVMDEAGIDAFDIDDGCYEAMEWIFPPVYYGNACIADSGAAAKTVTKKPVMVSGNMTPESALEAVEAGKIDYAMLGRGLIADPEFVNKLRKDREEDLRPCLQCNQFCIGNALKGLPITCAINAQAMGEKLYQIKKTDKPKNVVVVGGGPGGMEAARVAAEAGHKVTLYEKSDKLGGQILASVDLSFKRPLKKYMEYLSNQITKLGVNVCFGKTICADSPELETADEIIVALGAKPVIPNIPGVEKTIDIFEAHTCNKEKLGEKITIIGGGASGCEFALEMALEGKQATVVEMLDEVLVKSFICNKIALMKKMAEHGVNIMTGNKVLEVTDNGVITEDKNGEKHTVLSDSTLLAIGTRSYSEESNAIQKKYPYAKCIGDCVSVGLIGDAVRAGFFAAWSI